MRTKDGVRIQVEVGDVLQFHADILVLKYAQSLHGADLAVHDRLFKTNPPGLPQAGRFLLHESEGRIPAGAALFVGVKPLDEFHYAEIREFAREALAYLGRMDLPIRHLALTLHGPGYGLDEKEAFESELAGLLDAVVANQYPELLETISFVEQNAARARRLTDWLHHVFPDGRLLGRDAQDSPAPPGHGRQASMRSAGYASIGKPHIFVAMPFGQATDDLFHYGIQGAVNAAGFLCERADIAAFTGDILQWIKSRISTAAFVIAEMTSANPNVYLEVGYAWGCRIPTVLLVKDPSDLKFDVRSQRCIVYKTIKQLEEELRRELQVLGSQS